MAVSNTVEAVLRSKFEDRVTAGVAQTVQNLKQAFGVMLSNAASLASGFGAAVQSMAHSIISFGGTLTEKSAQSESSLKKFGLVAAGASAMVVGAFLAMASAAAAWAADLLKRSGEVLELRLAFESLTATIGKSANAIETQLRRATEGTISSMVLLRNANRVLSADLPITTEQYTQLVGNVFKLAKASGVDGTQAINTLTDALVRGNARGLHAIGIQMGMKDAINQMALALGESASKLETETRQRTFINELLERTTAAAARNKAEYFSMADAMTKARIAWDEFLLRLGEGVGRSGVVAELLNRVNKALDNFVLKEDGVTRIALAVNRFAISAIRGFANVMEVLGVLSTVWDVVWGAVKLVVYSAGAMIASVLTVIQWAVDSVVQTLAKLPGAAGRMFSGLAGHTRAALNTLVQAVELYTNGAKNAFSGFDEGRQKANAMAESARRLATDLEKYTGEVIRGAAGTRQLNKDTADAAEAQKKLNDQLRAYRELLRDLSKADANPYQAAFLDWQRDLDRINAEITAKGAEWDARRDQLRLAAMEKYFARVREIGLKAAEEAAEAQRRVEEAMRPQADLSKMPAPPTSPMPPAPPQLTALQQQMLQLREEIGRLNGVKLDGFSAVLAVLKTQVAEFAGSATQAFAAFFADMVSGQQDAGKKFLAAMLGLLGQMLVRIGTMMVELGVAEMILASSPFTAWATGSTHAHAQITIAKGVAIAAAGGVMMGAASAMASTNSGGAAGSSSQQDVPRPTSPQQVQVIQVGAAGRAQNIGQAAAAQPVELRVKVESNDSHIVRVVEKNAGANGRLRVVMQNG